LGLGRLLGSRAWGTVAVGAAEEHHLLLQWFSIESLFEGNLAAAGGIGDCGSGQSRGAPPPSAVDED
ncbi:hypothetical protein CLOM_g15801, partial [Closterium sp. NIES-68]